MVCPDPRSGFLQHLVPGELHAEGRDVRGRTDPFREEFGGSREPDASDASVLMGDHGGFCRDHRRREWSREEAQMFPAEGQQFDFAVKLSHRGTLVPVML